MALIAQIYINDTLIEVVTVQNKGLNKDGTHHYKAERYNVEHKPGDPLGTPESTAEFDHHRGDGASICLSRAITALREDTDVEH